MRRQILFLFLIFSLSGTVFGQAPALVLDSTDIRMENSFYNNVAGIIVFIRKKPGIESVMLTEPSGAFALRATEWNPVNGNERRAISGVLLNDVYSRYSIVSSTPQPDAQFVLAFQLFIPSVVVYGNPGSPSGIVYRNINIPSEINIRTFDQKYADPNRSRFHNNYYTIGNLSGGPVPPIIPYSGHSPADLRKAAKISNVVIIRQHLKNIFEDTTFLETLTNEGLMQKLIDTFYGSGK